MAEARIIHVHDQFDEGEDEPVAYIVEYTIPDYAGTFRTDPIPADQYDEERAKTQVRREAPMFDEGSNAPVLMDVGGDLESRLMSRRRAVAYSTVLFGGLGGALATIGGFIDPFGEEPATPTPQRANTTGTPTVTPTQTATSEPMEGFGAESPTPTRTATDTSTRTPTPANVDGESVTFQFADDAEGWSVGKRVDERSTAGDGGWSDQYDGSLRLHVDGSPSAVQTWRAVDSLAEGQTVTVEYAPERFAYSEAGIHLRLVTSDDERIGLDSDNDMSGGGQEQDGTLTGQVPRDLSNPELEIHLVIWPGETTVWVNSVAVE